MSLALGLTNAFAYAHLDYALPSNTSPRRHSNFITKSIKFHGNKCRLMQAITVFLFVLAIWFENGGANVWRGCIDVSGLMVSSGSCR